LENKVVELGIVERASDSTIGRTLKKTISALRAPCGIETDGRYTASGRERPLRFWWHGTPLKNLVHGLLRT
jgi:hypothetical protein